MNKVFSAVAGWVVLLASITAAGQSNPIKDKTLLWRISGNHLKKPSYLFGTIHMICRSDFVWTGQMNDCLHKSENVCFEMNLNDPNVINEAATALVEDLGKKLMNGMSDDQVKTMQSFLTDSSGGDKSLLSGQPDPMAIQSMFGLTGMNCADPISYEDSIMKLALVDKKEIMGLETPAEQIAVLETIPLDSLFSMLMESMSGKDSSDKDGEELTAAYKSQDLPKLYTLITGSKSGMDMSAFLDDRNRKWIPRMADKMQHSSVFFAVGAGHLAGQNGVINLLRLAGYKVEPIIN